MNYLTKKIYFSLIELLVVLAISIVLLAIAVPAFNSLTKGQSVEIGARTIGSQLKAVRSYAITNREYVALVFPTTESGISNDYLYKSFRACIVDSSNVFESWITDEKWEFMPKGAAILEIDNSNDLGTIGNFNSAQEISSVDLTSIGGSSSVSSVKGLIFRPTGKCEGATTAGIFVNIGGAIGLQDGIDSVNNNIDIRIDLYTGRITYETE